MITLEVCAISGFRREAAENRALLGYYAASNGNFLPTFLNHEDATHRLSRNVRTKLPLRAAKHLIKAHFSTFELLLENGIGEVAKGLRIANGAGLA
jgi:hypothetical protein